MIIHHTLDLSTNHVSKLVRFSRCYFSQQWDVFTCEIVLATTTVLSNITYADCWYLATKSWSELVSTRRLTVLNPFSKDSLVYPSKLWNDVIPRPYYSSIFLSLGAWTPLDEGVFYHCRPNSVNVSSSLIFVCSWVTLLANYVPVCDQARRAMREVYR